MRTLLAVLLALATPLPGRAQDLEPSLDRAARAVSAALVEVLPGRGLALEGLAIEVAPGTPARLASAATEALLADGFRLQYGDRRGGGEAWLPLRIEGALRDGAGWIAAAAPPVDWRIARRFAGAAWVDGGTPEEVVVEGPLRADRAEAAALGGDLAARRVLSRLGIPEDLEPARAIFRRLPTRVAFAEARSDEGILLHRAYVGVKVGEDAERRLVHAMARHRRWMGLAPWIRGAGALVLAVALGLAYCKADLVTKGYATGRLRLAFGMLLALGLVAWWKVVPW